MGQIINAHRRFIRPYDKPSFVDTQRFGLNRKHPFARGLVGCWLFNEGGGNQAVDLSGNQNHGTLVTPDWAASRNSFALNFDGATSGDYVTVKTTKVIADSLNSSVLAWIKTTSGGQNNGNAIYCERTGTGNDIWKFDSLDAARSSNGIQFVHRDDAGSLTFVYAVTEIVINDGIWHFVAVTKAGTSITLYVDGVVDTTGTLSGSDNFTDAGIESWIGGDKADGLSRWPGLIDSLWTYNRALSAVEIAYLYRESYAMFEHPARPQYFFVPAAAGGLSIPVAMHQLKQQGIA